MTQPPHPANDGARDLVQVVEQMSQLVHDLRNPVGAVGMAIEILMGPFAEHLGALPEPARESVRQTLRALSESASQLRHLVEDLTTLGASARGQIHISQATANDRPIVPAEPVAAFTSKPTIVNLRELLGRLEILTVTRSALPALLAVDCEPGVTVEVTAPELLRAMSNLVENAIEASAAAAPGDEPWTVWIRVREQGSLVCVDVSNLGEPPATDVLRWLEAPAGRGESPASTKPEHGLHGVGLPIVRRVAEAAGGALVARHRDGTTVMTIQLPALAQDRSKAS